MGRSSQLERAVLRLQILQALIAFDQAFQALALQLRLELLQPHQPLKKELAHRAFSKGENQMLSLMAACLVAKEVQLVVQMGRMKT